MMTVLLVGARKEFARYAAEMRRVGCEFVECSSRFWLSRAMRKAAKKDGQFIVVYAARSAEERERWEAAIGAQAGFRSKTPWIKIG